MLIDYDTSPFITDDPLSMNIKAFLSQTGKWTGVGQNEVDITTTVGVAGRVLRLAS